MVAVPEQYVPVVPTDTGFPAAAGHRHRAVAVAVSATELLRPESDLARIAEEFPTVDVLLATEDRPADPDTDDGYPGDGYPGDGDPDEGGAAGGDDPDALSAELAGEVRARGLSGVALHRLGLVGPLTPTADDDLVAALSELVGFDPGPGLYFLAPTPVAGDPNRAAVGRAAQRIAQVYGLPLLRYRSLQFRVVGDASD